MGTNTVKSCVYAADNDCEAETKLAEQSTWWFKCKEVNSLGQLPDVQTPDPNPRLATKNNSSDLIES